LGKILVLKDLVDSDLGHSRQNLEAMGLAGKILTNKELGADLPLEDRPGLIGSLRTFPFGTF
jgi:hypothetical protein